MYNWLIFILLLIAAYVLGSIPFSQMAAKTFHGIDLRECGTGQTGGGNLWRMTSWRLGLSVGTFDVAKGLVIVILAKQSGMDIPLQILVGSGAIIGHNWSVFARFSGGRGIATAGGIVLILPIINDMTPWATVAFFAIIATGTVITRTSPLPVLIALISLPIVSWVYNEPITVIFSFLVIFLIVVVKRLTVPLSSKSASLSKGKLIFNRFLFDRDISDRKSWMYQNFPSKRKKGEEHYTK